MEEKTQLTSKLKVRKQLFTNHMNSTVTFRQIECSHKESLFIDDEFIYVTGIQPNETLPSNFADILIDRINNEITRQEKVLAERKERAAILINNLNLFKQNNGKDDVL